MKMEIRSATYKSVNSQQNDRRKNQVFRICHLEVHLSTCSVCYDGHLNLAEIFLAYYLFFFLKSDLKFLSLQLSESPRRLSLNVLQFISWNWFKMHQMDFLQMKLMQKLQSSRIYNTLHVLMEQDWNDSTVASKIHVVWTVHPRRLHHLLCRSAFIGKHCFLM